MVGIGKKMESIALEAIWEANLGKAASEEGQVPQHIRITGEAGHGKTTLTRRIAYQWSQKNIVERPVYLAGGHPFAGYPRPSACQSQASRLVRCPSPTH